MATLIESPIASPSTRTINRRTVKRKVARQSTSIEVRKGALGLGPNLAIRLLDISESGVRVIVKSALEIDDKIEVSLTTLGVKAIKRIATVSWTAAVESGGFAVGCGFEKYLTFRDLTYFARP